ncbi:hypothetical protein HRI_003128200 [Hibiscus trionum]|uniref:CCHC-type domain-containing protein n=1 Tax=Hibiscus trionum TaxID=183268 RepID=A0A9W7ICV8_HIBTR|nr:hypothetical protein HRI_003128200 [Hibiscus trionum]
MVQPEPRAEAPGVEPVVRVEAQVGEPVVGVRAPPPPPPPLPPPPGEGGEAGVEGEGPQGGQGGQVPAGIDLAPLVQAIAGAFQAAVAGGQAAAHHQGEGTGLPLERLRGLGAEEFRGATPERSELWFEKTVRILAQMRCTGERKLGCIVSLLQGDAYTCWTTVISGMAEADITWEFFRNAFKRKYLGVRYLDEKKREFMALVQGNRTMSEYEIQFVRLSQYAPELIPEEKERCERFRYGLTTDVKTYMLASDYTEFDVLVSRAKDVEQNLSSRARAGASDFGKRHANWDRDHAKRHRDRRYQPDTRPRGGNHGQGRQGQGAVGHIPECTRCGRRHPGECMGMFGACWNCSSRDHLRRDCPHPVRGGLAPARGFEHQRGRGRGRGNFQPRNEGQRNLAHVVAVQPEGGGPARVYAQREAGKDIDVIAGNFTLQSLSLLSLIDSGSTHSYILGDHAKSLELPCDWLEVGVNVTSSFVYTVVVRKMYRRCPLMIQGHVFPVDMMEPPFYGFDVILGMDWLVEHRARVDFETKRVSLRLTDDFEVVVVGENVKFLSNVVLALEAQRLLGSGCQAYLAYVMNSDMSEVRPRDIRTVCDFPSVFPEELLGLPPDRAVEFAIETYSDSAPVSIAPYRMAPKELKELKT